jgi:hypothetical protein
MTKDELRETLAVALSGTTCTTERSHRIADAVLAALRDAGLAIVPKEPSEAMIAAVSDQAWRGGYCTERPQQNYSGGSALFTEAEATPMVRAMLSAGDLLGERGS